MLDELALATNVGVLPTVTEIVSVSIQVPLAPVTVYVVGTAGETTTALPVREPGIHVYVVAPVAVKVALFPLQTVVAVLLTLTVGVVLTVRLTVRVTEQLPLDPVTEYTVVEVGFTTMEEVVKEPGIQVQLVAPLADKVEEAPEQIEVGEAVAITVGDGLTVIVIVSVSVQEPLAPVKV